MTASRMVLSVKAFTAAIAVALFSYSPAGAQPSSYPSQPIRIIVPFAAGSATDILARVVSDKLGERVGQPVIVENRPGLPGTTAVARSAPDGHTLMLTSSGHTIIGVVNKDLPFDPVKDFMGVATVATIPYGVVVPPDFQARSVRDLIQLAKASPGKLNFASSGGVGSGTFIATVLFREMAGIDIVYVAYKGGPDSLQSVMRNDTQMYFGPINAAVELKNAGKVNILAVATNERVPTMMDVPTVAESGLPGYSYQAWFGIMAPAGTPAPIVARLNREIGNLLSNPALRDQLIATGAIPLISTPEEFSQTIASDTQKLKDMFKDGVR